MFLICVIGKATIKAVGWFLLSANEKHDFSGDMILDKLVLQYCILYVKNDVLSTGRPDDHCTFYITGWEQHHVLTWFLLT